ncbi:MAG: hypothetical protein AB7V18_18130 [Pyrinomonadaceae bacterium]
MVDASAELIDLLRSHIEWLALYENGRTFPLLRDEIDVEAAGEKLFLSLPAEKGSRSWRITHISVEGGSATLSVSGRFGAGAETLRLVPRTSAAELAMEVELARLSRANEIARTIVDSFPMFRIVRVALNDRNGRIANIIIGSAGSAQTGVIADVTNSLRAETLMATAFLWRDRLNERRKRPIEDIWIAAGKKQARALRRLHALLARPARSCLSIMEMTGTGVTALDEWTISSLWRERPKRLSIPSEVPRSKTVPRVIDLEPAKIDVVRSKNAETLRFRGLPFARVRTLMGKEQAWFGVGKSRRPLVPDSRNDLVELIREVSAFRRHDTPNPRHAFYRASPELWLESILKRDISRLDPNLILSPVYNQFRSSSGKIDLLALRKDGRLVIIELKAAPDREMVFQAADYWRKIELQRRKGILAKARLFGELEIRDAPALVYAVAPALSFHHRFEYFARKIAPEIELWRFELHEDWRREINVVGRVSYAN